MSQRSPMNDRYKTEQKGKTRRSASAAKPKRDVADLAPASSAKAPAKKKGLFSARGSSRPSAPMLTSPRLTQLRRIWWILWVLALAVAIVILWLQQAGPALQFLVPFGWAVWAVAMGGAFYIEFLPIRKERAALIEAAKKGGKASKKDRPEPPAPEPPSSDEPPAPTPITSA